MKVAIVSANIGIYVAHTLAEHGHEVIVLDHNELVKHELKNFAESLERTEIELQKLVLEIPYMEEEDDGRSGWYQPMKIGKPNKVNIPLLRRARSKPITLCRYKHKSKKQKKYNSIK